MDSSDVSSSPGVNWFASLANAQYFAMDRPGHYRALAQSTDSALQIGSWRFLIEMNAVRPEDYGRILELSRHAAVRTPAYAYFSRHFERELADAVAAAGDDTIPDLDKSFLLAEGAGRAGEMVELEAARFRRDGSLQHLTQAALHADAGGGWKAALPWYVRAVALDPLHPERVTALAMLLDTAGQVDLLQMFLATLPGAGPIGAIVEFFTASLELSHGDAERCLARIDRLEQRGKANNANFNVGALGEQLRARAQHAAGRYIESFRHYAKMNAADAPSFGKQTSYLSAVQAGNAVQMPRLPDLDRPDRVMMLGFPRSGTTLLENALDAHPAIDTLEEIRSLQAARVFIERANAGQTTFSPGSAEVFVEARQRYFGELERAASKPGARVLVDKHPIRSAFAPFLKRLLPNQRYIFSVRHPYDVALSCFQQRFAPNDAMANFLNMVDTVKLYDFAMTAWFDVHRLDDPLVQYVRYDRLVEDFESTTRSTLDFLGLGWDPAVLSFAERSAGRGTRTPSYQKVRQGLSIGVQTYWRNYVFLFTQKEAEPLTRWARFFGYETV